MAVLAGCDDAELDAGGALLDRDDRGAVTEDHLFGAAPGETDTPPGEVPAAVAAAEEADLADDEVLEALSAIGDWERAPADPVIVDEIGDSDLHELSPDEHDAIAAMAASDPVWHSEEGAKYEALFVTSDGRAFGRLGAAPEFPEPGLDNGWGSNDGVAAEKLTSPVDALAIPTPPPSPEPGLIGTNTSNDDRVRVSTGLGSSSVLEFLNDGSRGQSGSSIVYNLSGSKVSLAVASWALGGPHTPIRGPKFRTSMWNDVCSWNAIPSKASAYGSHSLCN